MPTNTTVTPASINGVNINAAEETLAADELRQRACCELLRQAAIDAGLLAADDRPASDGILSEAASGAIDALLEQQLVIPEPSADECQRHHAAHQAVYTTGERLHARHILFAVTAGVDVNALRQRAEATLVEVRSGDRNDADDRFTQAARSLSNCPSGADGGDLGWLTAADCAAEFAKEIFGHSEVGVLPRLVHSRFGFHVVDVRERDPGVQQPLASVLGAVRMALRQQAQITALRHYLQQLAEAATIVGVDIEPAAQ